MYVETSSREEFGHTRAFYEGCGYRLQAVLKDFFYPGSDKVIYMKQLGRT